MEWFVSQKNYTSVCGIDMAAMVDGFNQWDIELKKYIMYRVAAAAWCQAHALKTKVTIMRYCHCQSSINARPLIVDKKEFHSESMPYFSKLPSDVI